MNKKFASIGILVILVLSLMVNAVSAQGGDGRGRRPGGDERPLADGIREIIDILVAQTGLSGRDLMEQLRDGSTLAELIIANGGDVDAVIAEAITKATEEINQAVAQGRITQARADTMLANVETRITDLVNNPLPMPQNRPGENLRERMPLLDGVIRQALTDAGLDMTQVRQQLAGGATMRQILTDAGVDVDALVGDVLAQAQTMLDTAIANGRITAEQATQRLTDLEARINDLLDKTAPRPRTRL